MKRILLRLALALALNLVVVTGGSADPSFNPAVALQTIGGADMTRPASRDNRLPVEVGSLPPLALARVSAAPALRAIVVGSGSTPVLADGTWRWRFVQNTDAAVGVWCAFGGVATKAAPAIFLSPREKITWGAVGDYVPAGALACISDGVTGTVTLTVGQVAQ